MNEPALNKSFEERMFDQIKSQMGDLLTADELKKILDTAIQKAFFSPRREGSGYNARNLEPLFVELIRAELQPLIEIGVQHWLADNQDTIKDILHQQIGDNAAQFVANAFSSMMSGAMQQFSFALQEKLGAQGVHI